MPGSRHNPRIERNIHFVNSENDEIGGVWQNGSITWAEMSNWMRIVFTLPLQEYAPFPCHGDPTDPMSQHGPRIEMQGNTDPIQPGFYVLLSPQGLKVDVPVNPEMPTPRALSRSEGSPDLGLAHFRDRVRARDGRCVVTGTRLRTWITRVLQSAHIFPLTERNLWISGSWQQVITDDRYHGPTGMNSVQNGILLLASVHQLFDQYYLAINPDNDYKVYCFLNEPAYDGMTMFRNPDFPEKDQPSPALLKRHFEMAVLLNMKSRTGYPEWDEDLGGESCDQLAEITNSKEGKLRFETVLANKLNSIIS